MLTGALELFLVSMGLTYFLATTGGRAPGAPGRVVYYLVPCLNEEPVIEETVRGLLSPGALDAVLPLFADPRVGGSNCRCGSATGAAC